MTGGRRRAGRLCVRKSSAALARLSVTEPVIYSVNKRLSMRRSLTSDPLGSTRR